MPDFAGSLYSNAGVARDTAADTVAIFTDATEATDTTGTGSATALTQTDSAGDWSSLSVADGLYDVRITDGSSIRWRRYNDRIQLREIWVGELSVVNQTNAVSNQILLLRGNNSTRAANDEIYVSMSMEDSTGGETEFARITAVGTTVTALSEAGRIDFAVMTAGTLADELQLTGTALAPSTNDGLALGVTTLGYADLFLATGAVINWNNGEVTITETDANTLTIAGTATLIDIAAGILELNNAVRFDTGVAIVAASYSAGRDADVTNQLHLNVPTGATLEFSVNDVAQAVFGASALTGNVVGTGSSQVAQGSHTTPAATATAAGHVPVPPNNTTTFLRGDMTFAAPTSTAEATQTEVEAESAVAAFVPPDLVKNSPGVAKAWCSIDSAGTLRTLDYNIATVGDTGIGNRDVNYTTAFSGSIYANVGNPETAGEVVFTSQTTVDVNLLTFDSAGVAADRGSTQAWHGDQ